MQNFLLLSEFFGGIILFLGIGYLIGHLLKLDKYLKSNQNNNNEEGQNEDS
jgi:hypothetical protein